MKGSIYMVFDYMDHDLTGLMEREGHNFTYPQVSLYTVFAALCYSMIAWQPLHKPVCQTRTHRLQLLP